MDRNIIDRVSKEFALSFPNHLPSLKGTKAEIKARQLIESSPAAMLQFAAEVAMSICSVPGIIDSDYSSRIVKSAAKGTERELTDRGLASLDLETRTTMFWSCVLRVIIVFKSDKFEPKLTDDEYNKMYAVANKIKLSALSYKICSSEKVRDLIDAGELSL